MLLVLIVALGLVFDVDGEIAVVVDVDLAVFLLDARCGHLHGVGMLIFLDVDCGCRGIGTRHQISVQKIIKYCWEPTVFKHYW